MSGNDGKCPFCNSERAGKTHEDGVEETRRRVEANDPGAMWVLAGYYYQGIGGLQQDQTMAMELLTKSADLGFSQAHGHLGDIHHEEGNMNKAKFHWEAAAMLGHELARNNLGSIEGKSGNMERAVKHWMIAASAGYYKAMFQLKICFEGGIVSQESINSTLAAYNNSCAEMRSKSRDAFINIQLMKETMNNT
jgi:TPR repeat protein